MSHLISNQVIWKQLEQHAEKIKSTHLRDLLQDESRCKALAASHGDILLDYSRQNATQETLDLLFNLADTAKFHEKRTALLAGEKINSTEGRPVLHIALRMPRDKQVNVEGVNVVPKVHEVLDKVKIFADRVRNGEFVGATGKSLTNVVCIGIGGSFLGPEFVYESLRTDSVASEAAKGRTLRFLANVDPTDVSRALSGLDAETTLVIVVSKTFTTAETMLNARTIKTWLLENIPEAASELIVKQHMAAVSTALDKTEAFGISSENVFGFWDWVGGRFSVTSAVGVVPLALQYGFEIVQQFLAGAHDMDTHFFESPARNNIPLLLGLLGVWNSSFMKHSARAILPYAQALIRFSAHIQQLDMESNGKRVTTDGEVLPFEAGEIIFGEPGTNGQHSFYQLIHQGRTIPAEFIGFSVPQNPIFVEGEKVSNHDELMSNFFAQPDALAYGKTIDELIAENCPATLLQHKEFPGNRPSLSLLFKKLDAFSVGQLLAMYEHRVTVQGFIWGLNSFDQWGVELGKVLAGKVRNQLAESRKANSSEVSKFNSSTNSLLKKYLHDSA